MNEQNPLDKFMHRQETSASAPIQRNEGDKGKIFLIIGVLIFICLICTCCLSIFVLSLNSPNESDKTDSAENDEEEIAEELEDEKEIKTTPVPTNSGSKSGSKSGSGNTVTGPSATTNDIQWTMPKAQNLGTKITNPTSPSLFKETSGQFIKVNFAVKNIGSENIYVTEPGLKDSTGEIYSTFIEQWLYLDLSSESAAIYNEVRPGETLEFVAIYEVSANSKGFSLIVSDADFIGNVSDEKYISLGF